MRGPEDTSLEHMLAADEAAIRDDGFSERVADTAARSAGLRRFVLYGAGMTGFGFAVGGIVSLAPMLPRLDGWVAGMDAAVADVTPLWQQMQQAGGVAWVVAAAAAVGLVASIAAASPGR